LTATLPRNTLAWSVARWWPSRPNPQEIRMMATLKPTRLVCCVALVFAIGLGPVDALAKDEPKPGAVAGVGALLCTLVYSPLKVSYAATGLVVGSLAWLWSFGSKRVSRPIFNSALKGDYVVLPEHLAGDKELRFRGR
jgi:hypothetical protein